MSSAGAHCSDSSAAAMCMYRLDRPWIPLRSPPKDVLQIVWQQSSNQTDWAPLQSETSQSLHTCEPKLTGFYLHLLKSSLIHSYEKNKKNIFWHPRYSDISKLSFCLAGAFWTPLFLSCQFRNNLLHQTLLWFAVGTGRAATFQKGPMETVFKCTEISQKFLGKPVNDFIGWLVQLLLFSTKASVQKN